jgi:hypothetical protein
VSKVQQQKTCAAKEKKKLSLSEKTEKVLKKEPRKKPKRIFIESKKE